MVDSEQLRLAQQDWRSKTGATKLLSLAMEVDKEKIKTGDDGSYPQLALSKGVVNVGVVLSINQF